MDQTIQALFDRAAEGEHISLPAGEFEGPFHITKRCTVTGVNATLWAEHGPVLIVDAQGVVLRELRVDVTGNNADGEAVAILSRTGDTTAERVSVLGAVRGFGAEDSVSLPKLIALGEFPADRTNDFYLDAEFACETQVEPAVYDLRVDEETLPPGKTRLRISTGIIRAGTYLYGEIAFVGAFVRRVYISGGAKSNPVGFRENAVYGAQPDVEPPVRSVIPAPPTANIPPVSASPVSAQHTPPRHSPKPDFGGAQQLTRGQRIALGDNAARTMEIRLYCDQRPTEMEIDGFLFALCKNGKVRGDSDLIFFNQPQSADGNLQYLGGKDAALSVSLGTVSAEIDRIAVAFAIYGDNRSEVFGSLHHLTLAVSADGAVIYTFEVEGLIAEKAMVGFEFYRYQNSWKLSAIGSGYHGGMDALCRSYGVEVE
ncbi:MAG: TerD family protein [Ruminococcus sp.]|nr:TerD family protein [Ruminococcus sp.]